MNEHEHRWYRFTLKMKYNTAFLRKGDVYYIGYRCPCGEPGYEVPA